MQEVQHQEEQTGQLKDEIAVLKGEKKRPRCKPSKLDEKAGAQDPKGDDSKPTKRSGSEKRATCGWPPKAPCSEGSTIKVWCRAWRSSATRPANSMYSPTVFAGCTPNAWCTSSSRLNLQHREDQQAIRAQIWDLYAELKRYQKAPSEALKATLEARFEALFTTRTRYETLTQLLQRLHGHKAEFLLVLERPEVPLHTNDAENDSHATASRSATSAPARKATRDGAVGIRLPV